MTKRNKDNFTAVRNGQVVTINPGRGYAGSWKIIGIDTVFNQYRLQSTISKEVVDIFQVHTKVDVRGTIQSNSMMREKAKQIGLPRQR